MLLQMTRPVQAGLRQERQYELISHHLANADTTGYKKQILSFDAVFKATLTQDQRQGDVCKTENPLDLAIEGPGFFRVQTDQGVRLTRNGNFRLDTAGQLVTQTGDPVLGDAGPILINGDMVTIAADGRVAVDGQAVGTLSLVDVPEPQRMKTAGDAYFIYEGDPAEMTPAGAATIRQGTLERPNFSVVGEMTRMIEVHRMYETIQKMIQSFDEIDSKVINDVGRTL
ncbi:MAG: flagellar hook-basal body protein [Deltaproteobacteria bacterium]|nr:MAG: flagellar hook-basal body protein [Deltaproteobacteria bacterium]